MARFRFDRRNHLLACAQHPGDRTRRNALCSHGISFIRNPRAHAAIPVSQSTEEVLLAAIRGQNYAGCLFEYLARSAP